MTACGRGICAANDGHAGTCDEASGWADPDPRDAYDLNDPKHPDYTDNLIDRLDRGDI